MKKITLDAEQKGILRYLSPKSKEAISFNEIKNYVEAHDYEKTSTQDLRGELDDLIDKGYVCSKTIGTGEDRKELFYLTKTPFGGKHKRRQSQGRDLVSETIKTWNRVFRPGIFGCVFLLFGLGAIIYEGIKVTGAVTSDVSGRSLTFIFAFALMIIGGILVNRGFKKK